MQNVVDVASLSPPVVTTATKSAVQDPQAAGQESFDMALKKATNRIDSDQFKNANSAREVNSVSGNHGSISRAKDNSIKKESEVKNKERNEFTKLENDEKVKQEEKEVTTTNIPVMVEINKPLNDIKVEDSLGTTSLPELDVEQLGTSGLIMTSGTESDIELPGTPAVPQPADNPATQKRGSTVEVENTIPTVNQDNNLITLISNKDIETNSDVLPEVMQKMDNNSAAVSVDPKKPGIGEEIYSRNILDNKTQVSDGELNSIPEKVGQGNVKILEGLSKESIKEVEVHTSSSPPDTPLRAEGVGTHPVAQSIQINEPARLAEAPKNEVITQVTDHLDQMVKTNRSSLRLQLYPEELGHIDLKIVASKNGIGVTMVADKASTQEFLRSEMNALKQNIEQAGIQLNNLNINQGNSFNKQHIFDDRQNRNPNVYGTVHVDGVDSSIEKPQKQLNKSAVDYRI